MNFFMKFEKKKNGHIWPCSPQFNCGQARDTRLGIQYHEHFEHGAEAPNKKEASPEA